MGVVAGASALAGAGLGAYSSIEKGAGQQAADQFQSEELQRRAQYAGIAATQVSANMLDRLNTTLGNIAVTRAMMHDNPTSPTGAAVRGMTEAYSDEDRAIKVGNILAQQSEDTASANYLTQAGQFAYGQGFLGAGADILGAIGTTNPGTFGFGAPTSMGEAGNPTRIGSLY